jgi:predicted methyltransferase
MLHDPTELSATRLKSGAGLLVCAALALIAAQPSPGKTPAVDNSNAAIAAIAEGVADSSRPASDTARDVNRKPQETLAFAGVKPGDKIADYAAGAGYFTRLFADVVGPQGHVYASVPTPLFKYPNIVKGIAEVQSYAATHPNVTVTFASVRDAAKYPEKLDVFWISQNYHDLHDPFMGPVDMAAFNRTVYTALKPGGVYLVLDHVAAKGSPADVTDTLHRIEPSTVRREVEAAGFTFEGESNILANPADPHTAGVFDSSIQGRTDQFILKFRRPRSMPHAAGQ